eukprot:13777762-Heterocapsa_arctica.AAC.1
MGFAANFAASHVFGGKDPSRLVSGGPSPRAFGITIAGAAEGPLQLMGTSPIMASEIKGQ